MLANVSVFTSAEGLVCNVCSYSSLYGCNSVSQQTADVCMVCTVAPVSLFNWLKIEWHCRPWQQRALHPAAPLLRLGFPLAQENSADKVRSSPTLMQVCGTVVEWHTAAVTQTDAMYVQAVDVSRETAVYFRVEILVTAISLPEIGHLVHLIGLLVLSQLRLYV